MLWLRTMATSGIDHAWGVAADAAGNLSVVGSTSGSLFGTSAGGFDAFVTRYDASGNQLWARQFGTAMFDEANAVATDEAGNAYLAGISSGSLAGPSGGGRDGFVSKFNNSGDVIWSRQFGGEGDQEPRSVAVDHLGNVIVSGGLYFSFLRKYDANGALLWSKFISSISQIASTSVAVDSAGNTYMTGITLDSIAAPHAGGRDAFVFKYDPSGNLIWSRQLGTPYDDFSNSIAVDTNDNAYISGYTQGTLGSTAEGQFADPFLAKYDSSGNYLWGYQLNGTGSESSNAVAINAMGEVFLGGSGGTFNQSALLVKFAVPESSAIRHVSMIGAVCACFGRIRRRTAV